MKRGATAIILGVTLGFIGVVIYSQLRDRVIEDDADAIAERVANRLLQLEASGKATG